MAIQQMLLKSYGAGVVPWYGSRGLFSGGYQAGNVVQYITIASTGNASNFGSLGFSPYTRYNQTGGSGGGRAIVTGGQDAGGPYQAHDTAVYLTIANTGNASAYGDLVAAQQSQTSMSNGTTLLIAGGGGYETGIEYFTIATTADAQSWGTLCCGQSGGRSDGAGCADPTRGIFAGGSGPDGQAGPFTNRIQYLSMESTGNASDFGDLTLARGHLSGVSNLTRGVFCGGYSPTNTPAHGGHDKFTMDYITIQSTGNATDFGDLTQKTQSSAGTQSLVRGVIGGGYQPETGKMDYFTIDTTGNASDFGNFATDTSGAVGGSGD